VSKLSSMQIAFSRLVLHDRDTEGWVAEATAP